MPKKEQVTNEVANQEPSSTEETASKAKKRSSTEETASFEQTVSDMKSFLSKQPTVSIFIPLEPGEPKGTLYPVEMNGYKVKVPKNVYVDVPRPIADIIKQSLNVYEEASAALMSQHGTPLRLDLATGDTKSALDA